MLEFVKMCREGGAVKRYHAIRTLSEDTIASHSFGTTIFAIALTDHTPSVNLIKACLYHDLPEQYTGDSPALAKWDNTNLKRCLDNMEEYFLRTWNLKITLTEEEELILSCSDTLDLCFFCLEQIKLGNTYIKKVLIAGLNRLKTLPELYGKQVFIDYLEEEINGNV